METAGYYRFRIPDQTGELAALTAWSGQKPGLNGPPEATTILTQGVTGPAE